LKKSTVGLGGKLHLQVHTVKPVYNDHPWDPEIVVVVDKWSLFRGHLCNKSFKRGLKMVVVADSGRYSEVVVNSGLTVFAKKWF
jgi:hypothetical protein